MPTIRLLGTTAFAAALLLALAGRSLAAEWYVNNRDGNDAFEGHSMLPVNESSGPLKTIGAALKRLGPGDMVHVANQGIGYYESLTMVGPRFTGVMIEGNGAVVSGARSVPLEAWVPLGNALWRFTPRRKAWYQLISAGQAVPELEVAKTVSKLPEIPPGHWAGWRGSIYLQLQPGAGQRLDQLTLEFAGEEVGLTLLNVEDVYISGLEFRHFRLDGVNAHDRCRNVVLDGVRLVENGRAGLAAGGTSRVILRNSAAENNRGAQVLDSELARTQVLSSEPPEPKPAP